MNCFGFLAILLLISGLASAVIAVYGMIDILK